MIQWGGFGRGKILLAGGLGSSNDIEDGGNGGDVVLIEGAGLGMNNGADAGGDGVLSRGDALAGHGGHLLYTSGYSNTTSNGDVTMGIAHVGFYGANGNIWLFSGNSTQGTSGFLSLNVGAAIAGKGGDISIVVGLGI